MTRGRSRLNYHEQPLDPRTRCRDTFERKSGHHLLDCGHVVIAVWFEKCASNCKHPKNDADPDLSDDSDDDDITEQQFMCPTCIDTCSMAMIKEKSKKYDHLKDWKDPNATMYHEMYIEAVESEVKELRAKLLNDGRPCREASLIGELWSYGQKVKAQRARMLGGLEESMRSERKDRSRSPARDEANEGTGEHRSREIFSTRTVDPKEIESILSREMRGMQLEETTADHLANMLVQMKLREDDEMQNRQTRQLKEHDRKAQSEQSRSKGEIELSLRVAPNNCGEPISAVSERSQDSDESKGFYHLQQADSSDSRSDTSSTSKDQALVEDMVSRFETLRSREPSPAPLSPNRLDDQEADHTQKNLLKPSVADEKHSDEADLLLEPIVDTATHTEPPEDSSETSEEE